MQKILEKVRKAIDDYTMIKIEDKIAIGVSGGNDSLTLLKILKKLQVFYPKRFELYAITLDIAIKGMDFSEIKEWCKNLDVIKY